MRVAPIASMVMIFFPATDEAGVMQHRLSVHVDRTGAAQRHAAAELGAGHVEVVAQHPEQRRVAVGVGLHALAIDVQ